MSDRVANRGKYLAPWPALSRAIREENPICQGCGQRSSEEVDHIIPCDRPPGPVDQSHPFWDPENLQALCKVCHLKKTALENQERAEQRRAGARYEHAGPMRIFHGPVGSGKLERAQAWAGPAGLVIDLDQIVSEISKVPRGTIVGMEQLRRAMNARERMFDSLVWMGPIRVAVTEASRPCLADRLAMAERFDPVADLVEVRAAPMTIKRRLTERPNFRLWLREAMEYREIAKADRDAR